MCQRTIFSRSCVRIAEEVQLQAEEEWIVEALKKIKQQRNSLQIERLQLESLKVKLKQPVINKADKEEYDPHVSAVNLMNPTLGKLRQKEDTATIDDDALCNEQELNLMVSKPIFETAHRREESFDYDMEEEEDEDDDDDDEDGDDVMIDINMLMNGTPKC